MKTREKTKREQRGRWRRQGMGERKRLGKAISEDSQAAGHVLVNQLLQTNPSSRAQSYSLFYISILQPMTISAHFKVPDCTSAWNKGFPITFCFVIEHHQRTLRNTSAPSTGTSCLGTMVPEADVQWGQQIQKKPQHPLSLSASSQSEEDISTATINRQEPCHWHNTSYS